MDLAKLLILLAILGGVGGFIIQHDKHTAERAVLEAGEANAKKSAKVLQEVVDNADNLSKVRAKEISDLKSKNDKLAAQLAAMGGASRVWLDAPVDPDVRRVRHAAYETGGVGLVLHPDKGAAANTGAAAQRPDQRQPAAGSERQPGPPEPVQSGQAGRTENSDRSEQTTSILKRIRAMRGEK
jgi:hypothetical protein